VSTLAGSVLQPGDGRSDGVGTNTRFFQPEGIALDGAGTFAVVVSALIERGQLSASLGLRVKSCPCLRTVWCMSPRMSRQVDGNNVIRHIVLSSALVTRLVGNYGSSGSFDGVGTNAEFYDAYGIALDSAGAIAIFVRRPHGPHRIIPVC
jgi:hypothetical protein